jgi:hypothetical protein
VGLLNPHLDDRAFADVWAERLALGAEHGAGAQAETHLRACADCRARYSAFSAWFESLRADAAAEADEVFGAERLAAQQAQIVRRLEALEHPARVIAFPRYTGPMSGEPTGRRRWIAVAAAAGLVVGLGLGQLLDFRRATSPTTVAQIESPAPTTTARFAVPPAPSGQIGDEAFLQDVVASTPIRVPESLQYLNAITPNARDVEPR